MRASDCPSCYAAAERAGTLAEHLRRAAIRLHVALGHTGRDFWYCPQKPCTEHAGAIDPARAHGRATRDR